METAAKNNNLLGYMYKNKNFMFLHFVDNNINMEEKTHLVVHGSIDVSVETDRGDLS